MERYAFGTQFQTKKGGACTVISYVNNKNVLVMFEDGTLVNCRSGNLTRGMVSNPNKPSVFGVGVCDMDNIDCENNKKYQLWYSILRRAYSDVYHQGKPTYKDVEVCDRWKRFSKFSEDIEKIPFFDKSLTSGYELDKDILVKGNRIYSPTTVCFVPRSINIIFKTPKNNQTKLPVGVTFNKRLNKYVACLNGYNEKSNHIGVFETVEEAHERYVLEKKKHLVNLLDLYENEIEYKVYQALLNWDFNNL